MKRIILFLVTILATQLSYSQSKGLEIGLNYGFSKIRAISDVEPRDKDDRFHTTNGSRFGIYANFQLKEGLAITTNFNANEKELEFWPESYTEYLQTYENYDFQLGLKTHLLKRKFGIFIRPFVGAEYFRRPRPNFAVWCGIGPICSFNPQKNIRRFNMIGGLGLGLEYTLPYGFVIGFQPEFFVQMLPVIDSWEYYRDSETHRFSNLVWSFTISNRI